MINIYKMSYNHNVTLRKSIEHFKAHGKVLYSFAIYVLIKEKLMNGNRRINVSLQREETSPNIARRSQLLGTRKNIGRSVSKHADPCPSLLAKNNKE